VAHTASCSNAKTRVCRCGGCAGSLHGWKGVFALTQPAMAPARESIRVASEHEWTEASTSVPETKLTLRKAVAAVDSAKVDVIDWLSTALTAPPTSIPEAASQIIEELGDVVAAHASDAIDRALGSSNQPKERAELAESHLLCSILAALACTMQKIGEDLDKLTREIATRIVTYFIGRKRISLPPFMVKVVAEAAVKAVDKVIRTLAAAQHFDSLQRAIRILALTMCPAPEKHEDVVRCCLDPLREPIISEAVRERLKVAMPDWIT
jgi:hypothetical protein